MLNVLNLVFLSLSSLAGDGCTQWKIVEGRSCDLAGQEAIVWSRNCAQAHPDLRCDRDKVVGGITDKVCLSERLCSLDDPQEWSGSCSDWYRHDGRSCGISLSNQVWKRACEWENVNVRECLPRGRRPEDLED